MYVFRYKEEKKEYVVWNVGDGFVYDELMFHSLF